MKKFYRVMLGRGSALAADCLDGGFVGGDYGLDVDLTGKFPDDWRTFNREYLPVYLSKYPSRSKITAGLACGTIWTVGKGMTVGDLIVSPDGAGNYRVGEVSGRYEYHPGGPLPHRRPVRWFDQAIPRDEMSPPLQNSLRTPATVIDVSKYGDELDRLIGSRALTAPAVPAEPGVEDVSAFAMEKHLEDFLVQNWSQTELGKAYDIYTVDGEQVGQQYPTDTGPLDILAESKDGKRLLVVELKRGRASDVVVGQTLRYMGFVQELAKPGQTVGGVIIALEDDPKIRRALLMVPAIEFFRYQVSFRLIKA